ncbi:MAG: hypothetical protein IPN40_12170 [Uliginosibacterium sp.]|nr:hypothetical protein [Uliginosibacterium sp.]
MRYILVVFILCFVSVISSGSGRKFFSESSEECDSTYITPALGEIRSVPPRKGHKPPDSAASAMAVRQLLDKLEPGGPSGRVQVGYTLAIPVLSLYKSIGKAWEFDDGALEFYLDVIRQVERPIVVVLLSNHFSGASSLAKYLMTKPGNMALLSDGRMPGSQYYGMTITPFTLSANPDLEVNRYRFAGMKKALSALAKLDHDIPGRILAVTLGGETHQMFENLQGNTGTFSNIPYADFSQSSLQDFRAWLREKFRNLNELNSVAGSHFSVWEEVLPPGKDVRRDKLDGLYEHFDAYANGVLPVYGWVSPKELVRRIEIRVDGRYAGDAEYGLNRQDVYEARQDIAHANVGYRYDYDFRKLDPGIHILQVFVERPSGKTLLSETEFSVMDATQAAPKASLWRELRAKYARFGRQVGGVDGYADAPRNMQDVYYNPYAELWSDFRKLQVAGLVNAYAGLAKSAGFDMEKAFSHQILAWWNGAWNDVLFATGDTPQSISALKTGLSLYGGLTINEGALRKHSRGPGYGVPEFNPQVLHSQAESDAALAFHVRHCARFVSPYFFMLVAPSDIPTDKHSLLLISDNALSPNGRYMYQSIIDMAKR